MMLFSRMKSPTQDHEVEQQIRSKVAEQEAAQARKDSLMQRLPEIDKELPEALIDYFRELRGTKVSPSPEDILYKNEDSLSPSIEDLEAGQKVIPVLDVVPNRLPSAFMFTMMEAKVFGLEWNFFRTIIFLGGEKDWDGKLPCSLEASLFNQLLFGGNFLI